MPEGSRVVVILPDSVRNYMSRFLDDSWMEERHFSENTQPNLGTWSVYSTGTVFAGDICVWLQFSFWPRVRTHLVEVRIY